MRISQRTASIVGNSRRKPWWLRSGTGEARYQRAGF
jgi:hypothetical protein